MPRPIPGRRGVWLIGGGLVVVIAAIAAVMVWGPTPTKAVSGLAPPISGPLVTGGRFDLTSERGHWILVNFFASWCSACQTELPQLADLEMQQRDGLQVVSVDSLDSSFGSAEGMIRSTGTRWPLVNDPDATSIYGVAGLPESFLIDPSGRVRARILGGVTVSKVDGDLPAAA